MKIPESMLWCVIILAVLTVGMPCVKQPLTRAGLVYAGDDNKERGEQVQDPPCPSPHKCAEKIPLPGQEFFPGLTLGKTSPPDKGAQSSVVVCIYFPASHAQTTSKTLLTTTYKNHKEPADNKAKLLNPKANSWHDQSSFTVIDICKQLL